MRGTMPLNAAWPVNVIRPLTSEVGPNCTQLIVQLAATHLPTELQHGHPLSGDECMLAGALPSIDDIVAMALAVATVFSGGSHAAGPTQQELNDAANSTEWLLPNHDYAGVRYVNLDEINPGNFPVAASQDGKPGSQGKFIFFR